MKKLIILFLLIASTCYSQNDFIMKSNTYPIIEIKVDGNLFCVLIDTGSGINILDERIVKAKDVVTAESTINSFAGYFKLNGLYTKKCDYNGRLISKFLVGDIKHALKQISIKTKFDVVGILGTPAIKELGMVIDLSRGIVTINKNSAITVSTD